MYLSLKSFLKPFAEKNDAQAPYNDLQFRNQPMIVTHSPRGVIYLV